MGGVLDIFQGQLHFFNGMLYFYFIISLFKTSSLT